MFPTPGRQTAGVSAPVLPLSCASPKSPYFMVVGSDKGFTTPPAPHWQLDNYCLLSSYFLISISLSFCIRRPTFPLPISAAPLRAVTLCAHAVLLSHSPCFSAPSHMTVFLSTPPARSQWSCWTPPRCLESWTGRRILSTGWVMCASPENENISGEAGHNSKTTMHVIAMVGAALKSPHMETLPLRLPLNILWTPQWLLACTMTQFNFSTKLWL